MKYGFGIDLGGTTVKLAYFDEEGTMLHKWEIPTDTSEGGSKILPDIAKAVEGYLAENNIPRESVVGLGIGVPGPVDVHGNVNKCVNLGWGQFNISTELNKLTGFPVQAGNDANVAAMGEFWKGGGQGCRNMVLATLGTGVGGGIVVEGKLLCGSQGAGGEIGHMTINRDETVPCNCGKYGCVEQYCSATGIVRTAKEHLAANEGDSQLRALSEITCKAIFDAGKAGDILANEILQKYYAKLGEFLGNLCCVLNPEIVVLGGGVTKAGQVLLDGVEPYFRKHTFHACSNARIVLASLGNDAGAYGAFKLVLDAYG